MAARSALRKSEKCWTTRRGWRQFGEAPPSSEANGRWGHFMDNGCDSASPPATSAFGGVDSMHGVGDSALGSLMIVHDGYGRELRGSFRHQVWCGWKERRKHLIPYQYGLLFPFIENYAGLIGLFFLLVSSFLSCYMAANTS